MAAYVNVVEVICNRFCSVRGKGVTRRERIVCVWIAEHFEFGPAVARVCVSSCAPGDQLQLSFEAAN